MASLSYEFVEADPSTNISTVEPDAAVASPDSLEKI